MDGRPQISGILEITFLWYKLWRSLCKSPAIAQWVSQSTGIGLRECLATWIHLLRESRQAPSPDCNICLILSDETDNPWWCVFLSSFLIVCSVLYLWHYLKYLNCQKWLSHHFHKYLNYHNIVRSHKLWPFTVFLLFRKYWIWHRSLLDLCDTVLQFGQMCETCHGDWICTDSVEGDLRKLVLCKPTNMLPPCQLFHGYTGFHCREVMDERTRMRIWMRKDEFEESYAAAGGGRMPFQQRSELCVSHNLQTAVGWPPQTVQQQLNWRKT